MANRVVVMTARPGSSEGRCVGNRSRIRDTTRSRRRRIFGIENDGLTEEIRSEALKVAALA